MPCNDYINEKSNSNGKQLHYLLKLSKISFHIEDRK